MKRLIHVGFRTNHKCRQAAPSGLLKRLSLNVLLAGVLWGFSAEVSADEEHLKPVPQAAFLKDGRYVDLVGSEDYFVIIKDGVIVAAQCGGAECASIEAVRKHASEHLILATNQDEQTLLVRLPGGFVLAFCQEDSAPSVRRFDIRECDYNQGWNRPR